MKEDILKNLIHRLIEIEPDDCPLISAFLRMENSRSEAISYFESEAMMISKRLDPRWRNDFQHALDEIRDYLKVSLKPTTKSVAIYARWGDRPVFVPVQFEVALRSDFIVDELPHIYPLIELKDTYHRFVTVITTESEARILETTIGSVTEEILTGRPELRQRVGREWTQEHYRNHKDERDQQFVREKIKILDQLMNRRGHNHLVIAGSPKMVSRMTKALPPRLKDKLISTVSANPKGGVDPILLESIQLAVAAENIESHNHVRSLENAVLSGGLGVAGFVASKAALTEGYADLLIIDQDFYDVEMREELVRLATASGARIETVNRSDTLDRLSGVGCLLRYRPNGVIAQNVDLAA